MTGLLASVFAPPGIDPGCPVLPKLRQHVDGECDRCGKHLPKGRRRWCSDDCATFNYREFSRQHDWTAAREAALKRDGVKCVRCGVSRYSLLEVNHIVPRNGQGYGRGCHNHLDNLETLCHRCHVGVTNEQRRKRCAAEFKRQQEIFKDRPGPTMDEIHRLVEATVPS